MPPTSDSGNQLILQYGMYLTKIHTGTGLATILKSIRNISNRSHGKMPGKQTKYAH